MEKAFSEVDEQDQSPEAKSDLHEGKQALSKADSSSFWDWDKVSFPYFWRWQQEIKNDLRDGTPLWFHPELLPKSTSKRQKLTLALTRKRRKVTQRPGKWTGSIILTTKDLGLFVTVSQKKWDRARKIIFKWYDRIKTKNSAKVNFKELESDLGFLVHLAMTHQNMKPF